MRATLMRATAPRVQKTSNKPQIPSGSESLPGKVYKNPVMTGANECPLTLAAASISSWSVMLTPNLSAPEAFHGYFRGARAPYTEQDPVSADIARFPLTEPDGTVRPKDSGLGDIIEFLNYSCR